MAIEHNFRYHPPTPASTEAHAKVREKAKELALLIDQLVPQNAGREKAVAINHVESAMMWACAGIVRHVETIEGVNDGDVRVYTPTAKEPIKNSP